ncbi:MAG: hypothetical protein AAB019_09565 [Planctomycetota bacterium]
MTNKFNFTPTGIGSLPHQDPVKACELILKNLPGIPFWPQLPQRDFKEGMATQFSEGLPGLSTDREKKKIYFDTANKNSPEELANFYQHYLNKNLDYFAISPDYVPGLYKMLDLLKMDKNRPAIFIKGQITGPITWGLAVTDETGQAIIHNEIIADVMVKNLAMKALWQINLFANTLNLSVSPPRFAWRGRGGGSVPPGRGGKPIIFIDEPSLMGYGSAYSPLTSEMVTKYLGEIIETIHPTGSLVGIHCCGNTDWSLLLELPVDIISFDAYGFMDKFLLYADDIKKFINRGGVIAWGIVPVTLEDRRVEETFRSPEFITDLTKRIYIAIDTLVKKGIDKERILNQSLLTPSCGMGMRTEAEAEKLLSILGQTSQKVGEFFNLS